MSGPSDHAERATPWASRPRVRVMSYNVHALRDDLGALAAVVRDCDPDVLIVQEAPRRWRWRTKCARLAHQLGMVYAAGGMPSLGNLILTNLRVRVHDTSALQYPLTPGRHMRGAVLATCSVDRVPFTVVGSHLATDPTERPAQATVLKKVLSNVDRPVILAADLNEGSGGSAWRTLADGLVDVADATGGTDRPTFSCADPRDRIDALFVDPRFTIEFYDVIDNPRVHRASDHFPIVAELSLPGARQDRQ